MHERTQQEGRESTEESFKTAQLSLLSRAPDNSLNSALFSPRSSRSNRLDPGQARLTLGDLNFVHVTAS